LYSSDGASWTRFSNVTLIVKDTQAVIVDDADPTRSLRWELGSISPTATQRTITAPNRDLNLNTPVFDSILITGATPNLVLNDNPTNMIDSERSFFCQAQALNDCVTGSAAGDTVVRGQAGKKINISV